jgi:hypothetical protein
LYDHYNFSIKKEGKATPTSRSQITEGRNQDCLMGFGK